MSLYPSNTHFEPMVGFCAAPAVSNAMWAGRGPSRGILRDFFGIPKASRYALLGVCAPARMCSSSTDNQSSLARLRAMQRNIFMRKRQAEKSASNIADTSSLADTEQVTPPFSSGRDVSHPCNHNLLKYSSSSSPRKKDGKKQLSITSKKPDSQESHPLRFRDQPDSSADMGVPVSQEHRYESLLTSESELGSISSHLSAKTSLSFEAEHDQYLQIDTKQLPDGILRVDGSLPRKRVSTPSVVVKNGDATYIQLPSLDVVRGWTNMSDICRENGDLPRVGAAIAVIGQAHSVTLQEENIGFVSNAVSCPILKHLNNLQRNAVVAELGTPCLVVAGPGSGKTRVLTHRAAHLVKNCNVHPSKVMAVTFTNKAANEMKDRIDVLLRGSDQDSPGVDRAGMMIVGTFHSVCANFLRSHGSSIGIPANFDIADSSDARTIISSVLKEKDPANFRPEAVNTYVRRISMLKNDRDEEIREKLSPHTFHHLSELRAFYDQKLRSMNMLDFDDLLLETRRLLLDCEDVKHILQTRYHHVLVDEWQDTNTIQYDIVKSLAESSRNLFVVGDADQSIYKFRGADYRNARRFETDFGDANTVSLVENYRSTACIVEAAQAIIQMNTDRPDKPMTTSNEFGKPITISVVDGAVEEAINVIRKIRYIMNSREVDGFSDFAVLYRTNSQSRVFEEACVKAGVPYRLIGGMRFYERQEVKDVLAYLRLVRNPADNISCKRVINIPSRGIGARTIEKLEAFSLSNGYTMIAALDAISKCDNVQALGLDLRESTRKRLLEFHSIIETLRCGIAQDMYTADKSVRSVTELTQYKSYLENGIQSPGDSQKAAERWSNIEELIAAASRHHTLDSFLESVALVSEVKETKDDDGNFIRPQAVSLMTMHAGKGLEFSCVFMTGMEEGLVPMLFKDENPHDCLEEERRLAYVGMTRAKKALFLSRRARKMLLRAGKEPRFVDAKPSRFLADIPKHLIAEENFSKFCDVAAESRISRLNDDLSVTKRKVISYDAKGSRAAT